MQPPIAARTALTSPDVAGGVEGPLLTYCDDATGERTALTAADLGGWVARTASMLRDGCRLTAGARAAVLLPPHWQTAAVLLGAWSIGIAVSCRPWATAGLTPPDAEGALDAVFVARHRLDSWLESVPRATHRFVLGLAPDGAAADEAPTGYRDYLTEVRRYPDVAPAYREIRHSAPASPDGTSYQEWAELARDVAAARGIRAGDRILVDVATQEQPVIWLLAPLSVGASILLCANLDPATVDDRIAAEGITHVL